MYLEAVAMLPQIFMFQKQASDQGGIVEVRIFREYCSFISFFDLKYVHTTLLEALTVMNGENNKPTKLVSISPLQACALSSSH